MSPSQALRGPVLQPLLVLWHAAISDASLQSMSMQHLRVVGCHICNESALHCRFYWHSWQRPCLHAAVHKGADCLVAYVLTRSKYTCGLATVRCPHGQSLFPKRKKHSSQSFLQLFQTGCLPAGDVLATFYFHEGEEEKGPAVIGDAVILAAFCGQEEYWRRPCSFR